MTGRRRHGDLQGEVQELFAELLQVPRFSGLRHGFRPQCDCYRTEDPPALHLVVELPGLDPASVQIVAFDRTLLVAGTRERPQPAGARYHQVEIEYGPFQRRIEFTEDVDTDGATATYEGGMLRIELPVAERSRRRRTRVAIEVERR
ncbi:MAG TPA: Hsp20/alpha crystallin family protein [Gaiellaceae bacterium]|jgi:HSP20 family protein|nr:Hsp20/alpha crystallin family protein [Gaiellaceae bacterium]